MAMVRSGLPCPAEALCCPAVSMPIKDLSRAAHPNALHRSGDDAALPRAERDRLEAMFLSNLDVIGRIIRFVSQRQKLTAADVEEFASEVKLKLVEKDYAILRKFEGRSSLQTFLTVVIQRIYLDFRNHHWGKWRPSAEARRLGPLAMRLEVLMSRDSLGFTEACRQLELNESLDVDHSELLRIASRLPARTRRRMVGEEALEHTPSNAASDASALLAERRAAAHRIAIALAGAIQRVGDQDRLILRLRFQEEFTVVEVARALDLEAKPLYRRFDTLLRQLRQAMVDAGISAAEAQEVLNGANFDMDLALLGAATCHRAEAAGTDDRVQ
jgi:RNA polymerase sigma factor (sigma-70 family)